jgi:hypothetical protein
VEAIGGDADDHAATSGGDADDRAGASHNGETPQSASPPGNGDNGNHLDNVDNVDYRELRS